MARRKNSVAKVKKPVVAPKNTLNTRAGAKKSGDVVSEPTPKSRKQASERSQGDDDAEENETPKNTKKRKVDTDDDIDSDIDDDIDSESDEEKTRDSKKTVIEILKYLLKYFFGKKSFEFTTFFFSFVIHF